VTASRDVATVPTGHPWSTATLGHRAAVVVDLDAVSANVAAFRAATGRPVMAVVKADAYGHGLVPVAEAAVRGGATWIGVALPSEAVALRAAGLRARILCWLYPPDTDVADALEADADVGISSRWQLDAVVRAALAAGRPARVHVKADTGLSRSGEVAAGWPALLQAVAAAERAGGVEVVGLWSHFACADEPGHPANAAQVASFERFVAAATATGLRTGLVHMANTAATVTLPEAHYDLVRVGLGCYGLLPLPVEQCRVRVPLRPAMRMVASLVRSRRVGAGAFEAVVACGYGDGLPLAAAGRAQVLVDDVPADVVDIGVESMVVRLGVEPVDGAEAEVFGDGSTGGPTAYDWARWSGTIGHEFVTRIAPRLPRLHVRSSDGEPP
jgi:alanine racemase